MRREKPSGVGAMLMVLASCAIAWVVAAVLGWYAWDILEAIRPHAVHLMDMFREE